MPGFDFTIGLRPLWKLAAGILIGAAATVGIAAVVTLVVIW